MSDANDLGNIEVGILSLLFELYPDARLTADELIGRTMEAGQRGRVEDYEQALRSLRHAELVRETNGRIVPTRAALHFDRLPF